LGLLLFRFRLCGGGSRCRTGYGSFFIRFSD
jgi:hypothetical protein